jgi:hypothetical protein
MVAGLSNARRTPENSVTEQRKADRAIKQPQEAL